MSRRRITRRRAVGAAAGAAVGIAVGSLSFRTAFAVGPSGAIEAAQVAGSGSEWEPRALSADQGTALRRLVDAIIPRTDTPGAGDAGVHEYIDLAISLADNDERQSFLEGLAWLDGHAVGTYGQALHLITDEQVVEILTAISDENDPLAPALSPGGEFFDDLKRRTIFGYYTSLRGRVEELGLSDIVLMETFRGCRHSSGRHAGRSHG